MANTATPITYEQVCDAASKLEAEGEKVTIKKVKALLGGNTSRLVAFVKRWRENKQLASEADNDLSAPLRQAILAEFARISQKTSVQYEAIIQAEKQNALELSELLIEAEKQQAELLSMHADKEKAYQHNILALERKLAKADARLTDFKSHDAALLKKIEVLQAQHHQAEIEAAVAKAQCAALDKQLTAKSARKTKPKQSKKP